MDKTLLLVGLGAGALYLFSRGGLGGPPAGTIRLADGRLLTPDGRIVSPTGQTVTQLNPLTAMMLRASAASAQGGNSRQIIAIAAATVGLAAPVVNFLTKLLGSGSGAAQTGAAQKILTDPVGLASDVTPVAPGATELTPEQSLALGQSYLTTTPVTPFYGFDPALESVLSPADAALFSQPVPLDQLLVTDAIPIEFPVAAPSPIDWTFVDPTTSWGFTPEPDIFSENFWT